MTLSSIIGQDESLGRFLKRKSWFSRRENRVYPDAFMPPLDFELSVYRIDGLSENEMWGIGRDYVIALSKGKIQAIFGIAEIKANIVQKVLTVETNGSPHPRHSLITGWPIEKAECKMIAIDFASAAKPILK